MQVLKKSVCRTCLSERKLQSVFSKIKPEEVITYSEILLRGAFVQISEGDDMPLQICETCRDHLNQIYLFKQQCEKADFILRMQIKKDIETDPLELPVVKSRIHNATRLQSGAKNSLREVENSAANSSDDTDVQQNKNLNTYERRKSAIDLIKRNSDLTKSFITPFSDCKNDYTDLASDLFSKKVPLTRLGVVKVTNKQNSSILVSCRMCKKSYISGSFSQHWTANHEKKSESSGVENTETNLVIAKSSRKEKLPLSSNNQLPSSKENGDSNALKEKINDDHYYGRQTSEGIICLKCNKLFRSFKAFEKHLFVNHAKTKYSCKECNTNFIFREAFLQHRREVHNKQTSEKKRNVISEPPATEVDTITKPFQNRGTAKRGNYDAENTETDDSNNEEKKDIQVSNYNKKPDDIQRTNYANESKTVIPTNKWIKCLKCDHLSSSVAAFKIHLFALHNEMSFKCNKCARGFVFHKSLLRHKKLGMCKGTVKEQITVKISECTANDRNEKEQKTVKILKCTADDQNEKEQNINKDPVLVDTVDEKPSQNKEIHFISNDNTSSDISETNESNEVTNGSTEVTNGSTEVTNESTEVTNESTEVTKGSKEITNDSIEVTNENNKGTRNVKTFENIQTYAWIGCFKCNEILHSKSEYEKHLFAKHGTRLYNCKECNLDFLYAEPFLWHMGETHGEQIANNDEQFLNIWNGKKKTCDKCGIEYLHRHHCICCKNCNIYFKKKCSLYGHLIKVHKERLNPCDICGKSFPSRDRLRTHLKAHKKREIVCSVCRQTFVGRAELDRHLTETNERAYKCKICGKGFNTLNNFSVHFNSHYKKKTGPQVKFVCEFCGEQYCDKKSIERHIARFHFGENDNIMYDESSNLYICNICKRGFATEILTKKHLRRHTFLNKCKECGEEFSTRQDLLNHETCQHDRKLYKCSQCDKRYRLLRDVKIHASVHNKIHECHICKRMFSSNCSLKNHKKTHENVKQYRCHFCQKRFLVGANLSTHIQNCHKDESNSIKQIKEYLCAECGKTFSDKVMFLEDSNKHKGLNPYECKHCNKKFPGKPSLDRHIRLNHGTGKKRNRCSTHYECKTCNKQFKWKSQLDLHHRTHTGFKPYQCDQCDKRFTQTSHLQLHKDIHAGVKRHVCSYCKKSFTLKQYLRAHIRIHTGETYQCAFCEQKFHHYSNMRKHKLSHKNLDEGQK